MSLTPSSHRQSRGFAVPGIDTRPFVQKTDTAVSFGGWLTPPQSAHESRRPSMTLPSFLESQYPSASPSNAYSQPPAPGYGDHQSNNQPGLVSLLEHQQMLDHHVPAPYGQQLDGNVVDNSEWTFPCATQYHGDLGPALSDIQHYGMQDEWTDAHRGSAQLQGPVFTSGLPISCAPDEHTMFSCDDGSSPVIQELMSASMCGTQHTSPDRMRHSDIIVPSQLAASFDCSFHQQCSEDNSSDHYPGSQTTSFNSTLSSYNDWDVISPPRPEHPVCIEEDGFEVIKQESPLSPIPQSSGKGRPVGRRSGRGRTTRARKRAPSKEERVIRGHSIDFAFDASTVERDDRTGLLKALKRETPTKPFKCDHWNPKDNKQCDQKFQRREHLKRHRKSHSNERPFPCPIPKCGKAFGRGDNMRQHLKTHADPNKTTRRNDFTKEDEIEHFIRAAFQEKVANQLLNSLF